MLSFPLQSRTRAEPLSVVIADDVREIQHLVAHWLCDRGYAVACASSGSEAAALIRSQHVDLVITDVLMPDGDGLELLGQIKRSQPTARVLAISGGGLHLHAADCLKLAKSLGAHGVLLKPFNREQLLTAVESVLNASA